MVGMTYMPFDAMSTGCAVELSQKRHMTKTDTHTKAQVSITTHPRVGVLRIAVGYSTKKMAQGTKRKKKGGRKKKKKPNNTSKNMKNSDEHTHTTKQK